MDAYPSSPSHFSTSDALATNPYIRLPIYTIYAGKGRCDSMLSIYWIYLSWL